MRGEEILDLIHGMVELTRNDVKQVGRSRVDEDDAIPSDFRPAADGPVLFLPFFTSPPAAGVRGRAAARVIFVASEVASRSLDGRWGRLLRRGGGLQAAVR